ncbi:hypothetical protein GOBAR_AA29386 [Gossypium barbadense]|uniref:Leucine-rich repeat-containing N-terminal plant-type domain-containing protein n=2 Tax=Gossypium TaxID=3633 RepID=A0A2P5WJM7_GOSBA|nr:hypothetical protein GOBAR_AA29386 [Gossypium barbadense]
MESKWLAMVLVVLSLGSGLCDGCLEEERFALFQLKPFFEFIDYKFELDLIYYDYLVDEIKESSSNCCEWERVECNPISGRVTHLFLNHSSYKKIHWYLNASLFLPFEEIQNIYLSGNSIAGCVVNQGFERLSLKLDKLENLDLSENHFNHSILASLSELSSLKSLNLAYFIFTGLNPTNESNNNWMNLKELSLEGNEIKSLGSIFHGKEGMKLNKLEVLNLRYNLFNNSIFSSLVELSNLKSLDLSYNKLKGAIYTKDLNALSNLEELILSDNEVNGFIPSQGLRLMNLKVVDLSGNDFNNSILSSLATLSNLKNLSGNGLIDMKDLNRLSNLEELYMACNPAIDADAGCSFSLQSLGLFPTLKTLSLRGFNINETRMASYSHNTSVTADFTSLKRLELWDCKINKNLTREEGLNLRSLEELELYKSSLPSNFIQVFRPLISLKKLTAYGIDGNNTPPIHDVCELTNLQELDINHYNLRGSLPMCFSNLTSLKKLSLSSNQFSGNISILKSLTFLESLDFSFNLFSGNISALQSLTLLASLDLSFNQFSGNIPALQSLTLLESLDLSSNQFSGNISALESLTSLKSLDVSNNKFHIPSSLRPLCNLSKLKYLYADNNTIHADDHEMSHSLAPRFQLSSVNLSCCGSVGSFPKFLYHQSELQKVSLSDIYFKVDRFPFWLLENNTMLVTLNLVNCSLSGPFQVPSRVHSTLSHLDISNNAFGGNIPLGAFDESNYVGNPFLCGSLVGKNCSPVETPLTPKASAGNKEDHGFIDMDAFYASFFAYNQLEGSIPRAICSLNLKLQFLDLSMNHLSGTLPSCFKPVSVREVHLFKNKLQGVLPNAFHDSSSLVTLDLSYNHLKGNIPNWVSNLSELSYLLLRRNHFEGEISIQLCKLDRLSLIDLSQNNLSGAIPSCLKVFALNYLTEQYIPQYSIYSGMNSSMSIEVPIEYTVKSRSYNYKRRMLQYMSGIDLSCNKLTGEISFETKNIMKLFTLNLSHNSLTGPVPRAFSNLMDMESLDLSYNNLTGNIPAEFAVLHFLEYFNVSYNNLSGKTPERIG